MWISKSQRLSVLCILGGGGRCWLEDQYSQHISFLKRALEIFHADTFCIHDVLCRTPRKQATEAVVKVYEILGDTTALALVRIEYTPSLLVSPIK
jgi:hypothetical protein